ncbi:MAG: hypothetical protein CXT69_04185 [Methanobacteriota archaeon]|nr:MAG: hypothetical protein CXT69_04185 [Euryarchaeota archaeon]
MGRCPFCATPVLPNDKICYSCGRMTSSQSPSRGAKRGGAPPPTPRLHAATSPFSRSTSVVPATSGVTRGRSAGAAAGRGVRQGARGGSSKSGEIRRTGLRKGKIRNLIFVGAIAFAFLFTPAQEQLFEAWSNLEDEIMNQLKPGREYPVEASYSVSRTVTYENDGTGNVEVVQRIPVPELRTSKGISASQFHGDGGPFDASLLQDVTAFRLETEGQVITVPTDGTPRAIEDAISLPSGAIIYWPAANSGDDSCGYSQCVRWEFTIPPGETRVISAEADVVGKSWTWWDHDNSPSDVDGQSWAINAESSGTFADSKVRAFGQYWSQFGQHETTIWSDYHQKYLIDATHENVLQAATDISASLPEDKHDNAYAFARAAYDYLIDTLEYDKNAPLYARSGPDCLAAGKGDCDEQSNAWMSILRVKEIPTWYEFGALLDTASNSWEGHGWANVMLPFNDAWCSANGVNLNDCYIEGSVDVVNNKWLLHTPTAYSEWIEVFDPADEFVSEYYASGSIVNLAGGHVNRDVTIETTSGPVYGGGTYVVKINPEEF